MTRRSIVLGCVSLLTLARPVASQVLDVRVLNTRQLEALDASRTLVLLTGGILEEHGPFLPAYSDGYQSEFVASQIAEAVAARAGWTVLKFPPLALGTFPANEIGDHYAFPGSFTVRAATLRAVFMDLVSSLGERGFKYLVLVNLHGGPTHNQALDDVARYFNDMYRGRMLHVSGLVSVQGAVPRDLFTSAQRAGEGFSLHADADEHSRVEFLRPEVVAPDVASAPPVTVKNLDEALTTARRPDWTGYWGTPAIGSAAAGSRAMHAIAQAAVDAVSRLLAGEDLDALPRVADRLFADAAIKRLIDASLAHERAVEEKQAAWLRSHGR